MSYEEIDETNGVRLFGLFGWSSDDAISMTDAGDGIYEATVDLTAGSYEYKFRNGWNYEDVDELGCAVITGDYWNRSLTVIDSDVSISNTCWSACEECVGGCTDPIAVNYDDTANASS